MLANSQMRQRGCPRCGAGPDKVVTQRVSALERGYVSISQCEVCGYSTHQTVAQEREAHLAR